jgi:hypothetical protein
MGAFAARKHGHGMAYPRQPGKFCLLGILLAF